jgi:hypothetical protein
MKATKLNIRLKILFANKVTYNPAPWPPRSSLKCKMQKSLQVGGETNA